VKKIEKLSSLTDNETAC